MAVTGQDPRLVLATADLHYRAYAQGDASTWRLADAVCDSGADVLIIAGDIADQNTERLRACLDLFYGFGGLKLLVPGNHDVWAGKESSRERYLKFLPRAASAAGFHMLDAAPVTAGAVGFVGNMGWYDYSFRNPDLKLSTEDYERKELPGVCTWNDGRFIDWDVSDAAFTERCLDKLSKDYRSVEPNVDTAVVVLHHLPFRELLYGPSDVAHEFCRAYMGSERFGELLLDCPKVRYVICGHRHGPDVCTVGHIQAVTVGSDYDTKRLLQLDLATGDCRRRTFEPPTELLYDD